MATPVSCWYMFPLKDKMLFLKTRFIISLNKCFGSPITSDCDNNELIPSSSGIDVYIDFTSSETNGASSPICGNTKSSCYLLTAANS